MTTWFNPLPTMPNSCQARNQQKPHFSKVLRVLARQSMPLDGKICRAGKDQYKQD
jgi:hypothetical protein